MDTQQTMKEVSQTSEAHHEDLQTLTKLPAHLLALRPWSFSASSMPALLGYTLAYKSGATYNIFTFIIATITALSVHATCNVVSTYYDFLKGIDSKKNDDRVLVDKTASKDEITFLGVVLYIIGCLGFVILTLIAPVKLEYLALVYFWGLSGPFLYTGGIDLKYTSLGDLLALIICGPITVLFSYIVQTGNVNWGTIFYAIPLALNTGAILLSNNTRDIDSDRKAGIVTLAIIIGKTASEVLYALLLFSPYTLFFIWGWKYSVWLFLPLITLPNAFNVESHFRTGCKEMIPRRTANLNVYVGLLYAIGVYFSNPNDLPFIY